MYRQHQHTNNTTFEDLRIEEMKRRLLSCKTIDQINYAKQWVRENFVEENQKVFLQQLCDLEFKLFGTPVVESVKQRFPYSDDQDDLNQA